MELIDYMSQFPTSDMNYENFITQREHEELVMQVQDFVDNQNQIYSLQAALDRILNTYQPYFKPNFSTTTTHRMSTRVRCRAYYAILYFCLFCLRTYPNFFHPSDNTEQLLSKFINKSKKMEQQAAETVGPSILNQMCSIICNSLRYLIVAYNDPGSSSIQLFGQGSMSQYIFSAHKQGIVSCPYNVNEVFEIQLRSVLYVALDLVSNIRSKFHISMLTIFYFDIQEMIYQQQLDEIDGHQKTEYSIVVGTPDRFKYQKLVIIAGGLLNAIGSMYSAGLSCFIHNLSERKISQVDPSEQTILKQLISEYAQFLTKIVHSYLSKNTNMDYLDAHVEDILKTSIKQYERELIPKPTSDPLVIIQAETYFYLVCCVLIPFKTTLTSFNNLYQQVGQYFKYSYYANISPSFKSALLYAGTNYNNTVDPMLNGQGNIFNFRELFISLTSGYDDIVKTEENCSTGMPPMMLLIQALQFQTSIQPENLVGCLDNDNYIFDVSEYLAKYLQTQSEQSAEFIQKYLEKSCLYKMLIPHAQNEMIAYIAAIRGLYIACQYISSDRALIYFIGNSQLQINVLNNYFQIERNSYFPNIQFAKVPKTDEICSLKPLYDNQLEGDKFDQFQMQHQQIQQSDQSQPNSGSELQKRDLIFIDRVCSIIYQLFGETDMMEKICTMCLRNSYGIFLLEGFLELLLVSDYYNVKKVPYKHTCMILNVIMKICKEQTQMIALLQKFISLSSDAKLSILDCLGSYFLNRKLGYSIISVEILNFRDLPDETEEQRTIRLEKEEEDDLLTSQMPTSQKDLANLLEQEAITSMLQNGDENVSLSEIFKHDFSNIFNHQLIMQHNRRIRVETPFSFIRISQDKQVVEYLRILAQTMVMSCHDLNIDQLSKNLWEQKMEMGLKKQTDEKDLEKEIFKQESSINAELNIKSDINLLKAVISSGWILSFMLDETDLLKPETLLLDNVNFLMRNIIAEQQEFLVSRFQNQFKLFDKYAFFKRALFLLLQKFTNQTLFIEAASLINASLCGQPLCASINKQQPFDVFNPSTGSSLSPNVSYFLSNMMTCIANEAISGYYLFSQNLLNLTDFINREQEVKQLTMNNIEAPKIEQPKTNKKDKTKKRTEQQQKMFDQMKKENKVEIKEHIPEFIRDDDSYFTPLKQFVQMSNLPKIQSQPIQTSSDVLISQAALASGLGFEKLQILTEDQLGKLQNYSRGQEDNSNNIVGESQLMVLCVLFYTQVTSEEFKLNNRFEDMSFESNLHKRIFLVFLQLLFEITSINTNTSQPKQNLLSLTATFNPARFNIICELLFFGISRFIINSQLSVSNPVVWSFPGLNTESRDLYELIISSISQFYAKINDNEVKQAAIFALKQFLLLLQTRSVKSFFLPYKLDFILKIHQFSNYSDSQLQKIMISPYIQKCGAIELMEFFVSKQGQQQLCRNMLTACIYQFNNYRSASAYKSSGQGKNFQLFIPDSLLFVLKFHPQFESMVNQLLPQYNQQMTVCCNFQILQIFQEICQMYCIIMQQKQQFGFGIEDQFCAELFACSFKALEFIFTKCEFLEEVTAMAFLKAVMVYIGYQDMLWVAQNYNAKFDQQQISFQLLQQMSMNSKIMGSLAMQIQLQNMSQLSTMASTDLNKIVAKFLTRCCLNRNNWKFMQYFALKEINSHSFIILQAMFISNPIQYIQDFNSMVFSNAINAAGLLLAISGKTDQNQPIFLSFVFRNQLAFCNTFEKYLFEIQLTSKMKDKQEKQASSSDDDQNGILSPQLAKIKAMSENMDRLNPQDLQRYQQILLFIKEDKKSTKSQILIDQVVEYKNNLCFLGMMGLSCCLFSVILKGNIVAPVVSAYNQYIQAEVTLPVVTSNTNVTEDHDELTVPQQLQLEMKQVEIQKTNKDEQSLCISQFINALVTMIRGVGDFLGFPLSDQQILQMIRPNLSAHGWPSLKYLVGRLVFLTNSKQFLDNDFFQIIDYKQDPIVSNSFKISVKQRRKSSFHTFFPQILVKVFPKFWNDNLLTYLQQFTEFVKSFILGQGGIQNYSNITDINENNISKIRQLNTGIFGTVNQMSRRYHSLLNNVLLELNQQQVQNVVFDEEFQNTGSQGQVFNNINSQIIDFLHIFIQQLIFPEEIRSMQLNPDKMIKITYSPTPKTVVNIVQIMQGFVQDFTLGQQQQDIIIKTLDLLILLTTSQVSKNLVFNQIMQVIMLTAIKCPVAEIVQKCAGILLDMHNAGTPLSNQALLLIAGYLVSRNETEAALQMVLQYKVNHLHALQLKEVQEMAHSVNLDQLTSDSATRMSAKQFQEQILFKLCEDYDVLTAVQSLLYSKGSVPQSSEINRYYKVDSTEPE